MTDLDIRRYMLDAATTTDPTALLTLYRAIIRSGAPISLLADAAEAYAENRLAVKGLLESAPSMWTTMNAKASANALCGALFERPVLRPFFRISPYDAWLRDAWTAIIQDLAALDVAEAHQDKGNEELLRQRIENLPSATSRQRHIDYLVMFSDLNPFHLTFESLGLTTRQNLRRASSFWGLASSWRWGPSPLARGPRGQGGAEPIASTLDLAAHILRSMDIPDCPASTAYRALQLHRSEDLTMHRPSPYERTGMSDEEKPLAVQTVARACVDVGMYVPSLIDKISPLSNGATHVVPTNPRHFADWWIGGLARLDNEWARLSTALPIPATFGGGSAFAQASAVVEQVLGLLPSEGGRVLVSAMHEAMFRIKDARFNPFWWRSISYHDIVNGLPRPLSNTFVAARRQQTQVNSVVQAVSTKVIALTPEFYWMGKADVQPRQKRRRPILPLAVYEISADGEIIGTTHGASVPNTYPVKDPRVEFDEWQEKADHESHIAKGANP